MGNNNSSQEGKRTSSKDKNPVDFLGDLYGMPEKSMEEKEQWISDMKKHATHIYKQTVEQYDYMVDRNGNKLPYMVQSESRIDPVVSDNPKYIELMICKGDIKDFEKYVVHSDIPDHDCKGNCKCTKEIIEVKRPIYGKRMTGGGDDDDDDEDEFSETSDENMTEIMKKDKKKKKDEDDDEWEEEDDDEDDDDIELDNEEEDGYILENSDITSSDLYNMQNRIFTSDTESEMFTDDTFTDEVEAAMKKVNRRKKMFSTEEREILNMNRPDGNHDKKLPVSPSEKYMKKGTKKNAKYY